MRARFHERALAELRESVRYYNAERPGLGREFRDEVRAATALIRRHPAAWQEGPHGTRHVPTRRFPYALIYQVKGDHVLILAVAHLHRAPEYWRDRS